MAADTLHFDIRLLPCLRESSYSITTMKSLLIVLLLRIQPFARLHTFLMPQFNWALKPKPRFVPWMKPYLYSIYVDSLKLTANAT